jgi:tRNA(fMet)-specific endonuclease VapC
LETSGGQLAVSVITYGELCYGVTRSHNPERERGKIAGFLTDFLVEVIPLTKEIVEEYASLKREAERAGTPLDDFDLLIGATVKVKQAVLVTDNRRHFGRIRGLEIFAP